MQVLKSMTITLRRVAPPGEALLIRADWGLSTQQKWRALTATHRASSPTAAHSHQQLVTRTAAPQHALPRSKGR